MTFILCAVCILDPTGEKGEEQRHSYYVLCAACGVLITVTHAVVVFLSFSSAAMYQVTFYTSFRTVLPSASRR